LATIKVDFAISDVPAGAAAQILADLKLAVESLVGQGKSGFARREKAMTGQDLITLGLVSEDQVDAL
jgi:hypothetical protein